VIAGCSLPIPGPVMVSFAVANKISTVYLPDSLDGKVSYQILLHFVPLARPCMLAKCLLWHGFLNLQPPPVVLVLVKEGSGLAPPSLEKIVAVLGSSGGSTSVTSVPDLGVEQSVGSMGVVLKGTGGASTSSYVAEVFRVRLLTPKPVRCYSRKMRDNRFLNMKESLIAESLSNFNAPSVAMEKVPGLGQIHLTL
jgi:hypothetical protein